MKNVWKGLILGAITGAGIGLVLDLLEWLGRRGKELSIEAKEGASQLSAAARTKVNESELPDKAKAAAEQVSQKVGEKVAGTVEDITERLKDAEVPDRARAAAGQVSQKVSDTAQGVVESAHGVVESAHGVVDGARARA